MWSWGRPTYAGAASSASKALQQAHPSYVGGTRFGVSHEASSVEARLPWRIRAPRTHGGWGHDFQFSPPFLFRSESVSCFSCVRLFTTAWPVAPQAPLSVGFSRQESWSGLPIPSPRDLAHRGINPGSPMLQADSLPSEPLFLP